MAEQDLPDFEDLEPEGDHDGSVGRTPAERRPKTAQSDGNGRHKPRRRSGGPAFQPHQPKKPSVGIEASRSKPNRPEEDFETDSESGGIDDELDDTNLFYDEAGPAGLNSEGELSPDDFADLLFDGEFSEGEIFFAGSPQASDGLADDGLEELDEFTELDERRRKPRRVQASQHGRPAADLGTQAARLVMRAGRFAPSGSDFARLLQAVKLPSHPNLRSSRADLRADARLMVALAAAASRASTPDSASAYCAGLPLLAVRLFPAVERGLLPLVPGLTSACSSLAGWLHRRPETRPFIAGLPGVLLRVTSEIAGLFAGGRQVSVKQALNSLARHLARWLSSSGAGSHQTRRRRDRWEGYDGE